MTLLLWLLTGSLIVDAGVACFSVLTCAALSLFIGRANKTLQLAPHTPYACLMRPVGPISRTTSCYNSDRRGPILNFSQKASSCGMKSNALTCEPTGLKLKPKSGVSIETLKCSSRGLHPICAIKVSVGKNLPDPGQEGWTNQVQSKRLGISRPCETQT